MLTVNYKSHYIFCCWFCCRYGFEKNCVVVQWSGDNPNSLAGTSEIQQFLCVLEVCIMHATGFFVCIWKYKLVVG